jgi:hypothetical protein
VDVERELIEGIEAEEVEPDDRLSGAERLRVQERQHDRVTVARRQREVERITIGPAGMLWIDAGLDARTPQRYRARPQASDLIRFRDQEMVPGLRARLVEAPTRRAEHVVGVHRERSSASFSTVTK